MKGVGRIWVGTGQDHADVDSEAAWAGCICVSAMLLPPQWDCWISRGTHLAMCGGWEATLVTSESGVYLQCLLLFTLCGRNANNDTHLYL